MHIIIRMYIASVVEAFSYRNWCTPYLSAVYCCYWMKTQADIFAHTKEQIAKSEQKFCSDFALQILRRRTTFVRINPVVCSTLCEGHTSQPRSDKCCWNERPHLTEMYLFPNEQINIFTYHYTAQTIHKHNTLITHHNIYTIYTSFYATYFITYSQLHRSVYSYA